MRKRRERGAQKRRADQMSVSRMGNRNAVRQAPILANEAAKPAPTANSRREKLARDQIGLRVRTEIGAAQCQHKDAQPFNTSSLRCSFASVVEYPGFGHGNFF
jgi:hypothetical protein